MDAKAITSSGALRLTDAGDGVGILEIDVPGRSVNVLSSAVLSDLEQALQAASRESGLKALVVTGGKPGSRTFIAGADIDEIRSVSDPAQAAALARRGQEILSGFARLPLVTVAAINGTCLGGGAELALACDLRIAADDPGVEIGFPEVLLGIFPGFGGSQRLPRLIGIRQALDLILTGKRIDPRKAVQIGLVDRLAPPARLREAAVALAREALGHRKGWRPARKKKLGQRLAGFFLEKTGWGRSLIRRAALRGIQARGGDHYPAPPLAVRAVIQGMGMRLDDGLRLESELVGGLVAGEVAKNLIGIFQTGEKLRRGSGESRREEPESRAPRRVVILGAGVMGGAIAALLVRRGFRVRIKDIRAEALTSALAHAARAFDELVARRRMTRSERANAMSAISATTAYTGISGAEMVIEAVVEDLAVKRQVLKDVEPLLGPDAVFATNTSALSITALAEAAAQQERVVGLHFFNPVHRMPLVEVIRGERTSESALEAATRLAREIGKYPVQVKDGPGFLVNRLLMPYLNEAAHLFAEGQPISAIDSAMRKFGFPMGPFELLDEVGLDVARKVGHILHQAFGDRAAPAPLLERITGELKLVGKKGGAGFYLHGKKRVPNPAIQRLRPSRAPEPAADPAAWERRLVFPMVNEAARCLEEGIVATPAEVDVATVMGMAFPPFRGGLLTYADRTGLPTIAATLEALAGQAVPPAAGARYRPAELLTKLGREGRGFASLGPRPEAKPVAVPALQST